MKIYLVHEDEHVWGAYTKKDVAHKMAEIVQARGHCPSVRPTFLDEPLPKDVVGERLEVFTIRGLPLDREVKKVIVGAVRSGYEVLREDPRIVRYWSFDGEAGIAEQVKRSEQEGFVARALDGMEATFIRGSGKHPT